MTRRSLSTRERLRLFNLYGGVCHFCEQKIDGTRDRWEISHELALELGGADDDENRKPAHYKCHRAHTAEKDIPQIAKSNRQRAKHVGAHRPRAIMPGSKASRFKKKMDGTVERRDQ